MYEHVKFFATLECLLNTYKKNHRLTFIASLYHKFESVLFYKLTIDSLWSNSNANRICIAIK